MRYTAPGTGFEVKRRIHGLSMSEARSIGENLTRRSFNGQGYLAQRAPSIDDNPTETIRLSKARPHVKLKYGQAASLFMDWLGRSYPAVKSWEQLRPAILPY